MTTQSIIVLILFPFPLIFHGCEYVYICGCLFGDVCVYVCYGGPRLCLHRLVWGYMYAMEAQGSHLFHSGSFSEANLGLPNVSC